MRAYQSNKKPSTSLRLNKDDPNKRLESFPHVALTDYSGHEAWIAAFGEQVVGSRHLDIQVTFNYFINPLRLKTEGTQGAGSLTIEDRRLKVAVEGGAGEAHIQSIRNIVYIAGHDAFGMFTCAFGQFLEGTTQQAYIGDLTDAFVIGIAEGNQLSVMHRRDDVDGSVVIQQDFNLDSLDGKGLSKYIINPFSLNIFKISYGFLGSLPAVLEVYAGVDIGWVPFHTFNTDAIPGQVIVTNPNLPIHFLATSDGTNDVAMFSGSWVGGVISADRTPALNDRYAFSLAKSIPIGEHVIASGRVKDVFQGFQNRIPADLLLVTIGVDGTKPHIVNVRLNPTLINTVFNDVSVDSVMQADQAGTFSGGVPSGRLVGSFALGKIDSAGITFQPGEVRMTAGDIVSISLVVSVVASDVALGAHWGELK